MSDTQPAPAGPTAMAFKITYGDGRAHQVTTRPGDYVLMRRAYPAGTKDLAPEDAAEVMMFLAWLASRHDPSGLAQPDFETFLMECASFDTVAVPAVPFAADPGNAPPSRLRLPPEPTLADGSAPTPQFS